MPAVGDFVFLAGLAGNQRKLRWRAVNDVTPWKNAYTVKEAEKATGIPSVKITRAIIDRELSAELVGRRVYVKAADLWRWVSADSADSADSANSVIAE